MTKSRGYSYDFVQDVMSADARLPGVRLGRYCIEHRISVREIAAELGVSRQTIYWWFIGKFQPKLEQRSQIEAVLARHTK